MALYEKRLNLRIGAFRVPQRVIFRTGFFYSLSVHSSGEGSRFRCAALISTFYLRLFGFCVKAEPEEVFADLLDPLLRRVFDAAVAALDEVTLEGAFV
jgi:hypothetical protein